MFNEFNNTLSPNNLFILYQVLGDGTFTYHDWSGQEGQSEKGRWSPEPRCNYLGSCLGLVGQGSWLSSFAGLWQDGTMGTQNLQVQDLVITLWFFGWNTVNNNIWKTHWLVLVQLLGLGSWSFQANCPVSYGFNLRMVDPILHLGFFTMLKRDIYSWNQICCLTLLFNMSQSIPQLIKFTSQTTIQHHPTLWFNWGTVHPIPSVHLQTMGVPYTSTAVATWTKGECIPCHMHFTCCAPLLWYFLWYVARNQSAFSDAWKFQRFRYVLWCRERKEGTRMQLWGAVWSLLMGKTQIHAIFCSMNVIGSCYILRFYLFPNWQRRLSLVFWISPNQDKIIHGHGLYEERWRTLYKGNTERETPSSWGYTDRQW